MPSFHQRGIADRLLTSDFRFLSCAILNPQSSILNPQSSLIFPIRKLSVQDLRADRDAIGPASDTVEGKRQEGVENTVLIGLGLKAIYKEIRALNAIMHNKYSRVPEKLRAWRSATHIERAPERPKKNGGDAPASPPSKP